MNCCEALDALSFKWSSLDETSGPRQQPETISSITYSHNPLFFNPIWVGPKIYTV